MARAHEEEELDTLMARLATGDRAAFDPLFRALHPRAVRFARARVAPSVAEDAAQSALLKVFARASEFSPGRPVLPWFYAVCTNEIRGEARRSRSSRSADEREAHGVPSGDASAEEALLRAELEAALAVAVEELDGPSAEAIHAALGRVDRPAVPDATFRKRLSRAYERLRAAFRGGELEH
ncbi:MAG: sigma-70 family RNA polymerase sigma factor [Myxococcales bacterium]|nr:sigma-70 family RNA polymerase sigma factor [Myxococcales bacterium]